MLKNPAYYGKLIVNRFEYDGKKRTKKLKPIEEHITFDSPQIISKARWDRIQAKIEANKRIGRHLSEATKKRWLRDILHCDECGAPIKPLKERYRCYYRGVSKRELIHSQRERCELPYIKADELEEEIWHEITSRLTFGGFKIAGKRIKAPLEALADPDRYEREIKDLEGQIRRHEKMLAQIKRDYEKIADNLLEDEDFAGHKELFSRRLNRNRDEELRISGLLEEAKEKIKLTEEARDDQESLRSFLTNNKETMKRLQEDFFNLAADDKKLLIEGMIEGKIRIGLALSEGDEPLWARLPFKIRFNRPILERFIAEGKLTALDQNALRQQAQLSKLCT